ncbi:MAG TPA: aminotransferase class V-fold PLP-dependent enzyme [Burkholderiales bacterium]|nr:aminotransferase class V-fold PLP-dependent enzyme [Burkholderiales bacterium]
MTEGWLRQHVWPRFSRVMQRDGIYLANHSLGRPPDRMAEDVGKALDAWYRDLGQAWETWLEARERWRALTARLVGASRTDCIVPKTSAGQGLRAVLNALEGRPRVLASDGEFDSLDFILRVYRDKGRIALKTVPWRELDPTGCDLVVLSSVMFRSGEIVAELGALARRAHAAGAKVLLDVYHGAGVVPTDLAALEVDFAVGGSYKYLRGGPGACWLYVHPAHLETLRTLDTGWFAKRDAFAYLRPEPPQFAAGGDAWLESTPQVLAPFQARAGLELTLELGVERLRAYSLEQKRSLAALLRRQALGVEGEGEAHGAFLTLPHPRADELAAKLKARGVDADARGDRLRLCPDLLNSTAELERAAELCGSLAI